MCAQERSQTGAALRWCAAEVSHDKAVQNEQEAKLNTMVGSVATHLLIATFLKEANVSATSSPRR